MRSVDSLLIQGMLKLSFRKTTARSLALGGHVGALHSSEHITA